MLCVTRSKSQKSKFFDAARLAAKWDSMVAHNINKIMTKNRKHSLPKETCVMYIFVVSLNSVMFALTLF